MPFLSFSSKQSQIRPLSLQGKQPWQMGFLGNCRHFEYFLQCSYLCTWHSVNVAWVDKWMTVQHQYIPVDLLDEETLREKTVTSCGSVVLKLEHAQASRGEPWFPVFKFPIPSIWGGDENLHFLKQHLRWVWCRWCGDHIKRNNAESVGHLWRVALGMWIVEKTMFYVYSQQGPHLQDTAADTAFVFLSTWYWRELATEKGTWPLLQQMTCQSTGWAIHTVWAEMCRSLISLPNISHPIAFHPTGTYFVPGTVFSSGDNRCFRNRSLESGRVVHTSSSSYLGS